MKQEIIDAIRKERIIVIVRGVAEEKLFPLCDALYAGGIRLLEITFDPTEKIPFAVTASQIRALKEKYAGRLLIGAGTVVNRKLAELAVEAGASYLISPNFDREVIRYANERDAAVLPGIMTPTEAVDAYNAGADMVKVFPSEALGLSYIKAMRAPLAYIPMLAVGGVNEKNLADFLKIGVVGAGIGSNIVKKDLLAKNDYDAITALAKEYTAAVAAYEAASAAH